MTHLLVDVFLLPDYGGQVEGSDHYSRSFKSLDQPTSLVGPEQRQNNCTQVAGQHPFGLLVIRRTWGGLQAILSCLIRGSGGNQLLPAFFEYVNSRASFRSSSGKGMQPGKAGVDAMAIGKIPRKTSAAAPGALVQHGQ